jgi:hypothetical protein
MPGIEEFTKDFFDQSSEAWMKNKVRKGHSMAYICTALTQEGKTCTRTASTLKDATCYHVCKQHAKYYIASASQTTQTVARERLNKMTK